jgi:hypothetical protein
VREDFLRPPAESVTYADAASIATGKTGGTGADKFGGDKKSVTAQSVIGDEDDSGEDNGDEEDDEEAAASASRLRHFSTVDMRRLWAVDSLVGALRNPAVPMLRQKSEILQFVSFLALHSFADVSVPASVLDAADAEAATAAAASSASSGKASAKRQRAASATSPPSPEVAALRSLVRAAGVSDGSNDLRASAGLLVADPPISPALREELRARLLTLLHELPKLQLGGAASGGSRAAAAAAGLTNAVPKAELPPIPLWSKCQDRVGSMLQMQVDLATRVQTVWEATTAVSSMDAEEGSVLVATAFPSKTDLDHALSRGDDVASSSSTSDDEDESDSDESDGTSATASSTGVVPSALRASALEAARVLKDVAAAVLEHVRGGAPNVGSSRYQTVDAARQLLAYASLLSHGALQLLLSPGDSTVASAVADALGCVSVLQAEALQTASATLQSAAGAMLAGGDAERSLVATPGKKKAAGGKPAPSAAVSSSVAPLLELLSGLSTLCAPYAASTDSGTGASAREGAFLVLVDAALALLSNAGIAVREVVKAALRPLFVFVTPPVVDAILRIVVASRSDEGDGGGDDEDGEGGADGSDAESITLPSSSLLAPFTSPVEASAVSGGDKSSDDDEDAGGRGGADEMARYDSMLSSMLRMRKHARTAASHSRRRALHFKFRALALLDAAVSCLGHVDAGGAGSMRSRPAQLAILLFPLPLLRAARILASRARGQAADSDSSAGDAAALLARLLALLGRVTKLRVPALTPAVPEASVVLGGFGEVLALAPRAPTPEISRAAESVASMLLRALRVGGGSGSSGGDAPPASAGSGGGSIAAQVAPAFLRPVVDAYGQLIERHFAGKRSNIGSSFLRGVVLSSPVIAARLLPTLSRVILSGRIAKVFRLHEAVLLLTAMVRSASAAWAAGIACDVAAVPAPASAARKKQKSVVQAAVTAAGSQPQLTVAGSLAAAVPDVLEAITSVIVGVVGRRDAIGAPPHPAASPAAPVTLPVKQAKDAVALAAQLYKSKVIAAAGGSAAVDAAADALFAALSGLVRSHGAKHGVVQQAARCFELAGRAPPDPPAEEAEEEAVEDGGPAESSSLAVTDGAASVPDAVGDDEGGVRKRKKKARHGNEQPLPAPTANADAEVAVVEASVAKKKQRKQLAAS